MTRGREGDWHHHSLQHQNDEQTTQTGSVWQRSSHLYDGSDQPRHRSDGQMGIHVTVEFCRQIKLISQIIQPESTFFFFRK